MSRRIKILPSLLAADVGNLEAGVRLAAAAGADGLHIDIMDGHFVPNLSMGPQVVEMARRCTGIPLSVHLMMTNPEPYLDRFIRAGADILLIHIEIAGDAVAALRHIRAMGIKSGITLNPETSAERLLPVIAEADEFLFMSVHPGFGGQKFMPEVLPKIRFFTDRLAASGRQADIVVDGGIDADNAVICARNGANSFVGGASLYGAPDMKTVIDRMRKGTQDVLLS